MSANFKLGEIVLGQYHIVEELGRGGMGAVFKALDQGANTHVAIKCCLLTETESKRRFAREVRLMEAIDHPHVLRITASDADGDPPSYVMPMARNSIEDELTTLANDEASAIDVFLAVCEGIQAIHNAGTIHRDIKPSNALRLDDGSVVISDFGLAKLVDRDTTILTRVDAVVGTDVYSAPEQRMPAGSRDADARTDIFQLGKTLFELITGQSPALIDYSALPPGIQHIVRRATQDDPDRRYQTVGELIDAVNDYKLSKDPAAHPANALESVVQQITEGLKSNQYEASQLSKALVLVSGVGAQDDSTFVEFFDKIPTEVLPYMAAQMPEMLADVLRRYARSVANELRERSFSYGEAVASRMERILAGSHSAELSALACEAALVVAVGLNRFAAMEIFGRMLKSVKNDECAIAVAEMLRRQASLYRDVAHQVPAAHLHRVVANVRDQHARKAV